MDSSYIEVSNTTLDAVVKLLTGGLLAGIGWMVKRQIALQEKHNQILQDQANDITEIKADFKITNMRYDSLDHRVSKVESDVEKIKEKVY